MVGMSSDGSLGGQIRAFIDARFPAVAVAGLDDDADLYDLGLIDAIGILDIVGYFEDELGLEIHDADLEADNFISLAAMIQLAEAKQTARRARGCSPELPAATA